MVKKCSWEKRFHSLESFSYLKSKWIIAVMVGAVLLLTQKGSAQSSAITGKNIAFIQYPDFVEAHSTWGSIGYNPTFNTVYIGVTNHKDKVGLYEYHVANGDMKLKGFVENMGYLRKHQWQGKIH